MPEAGDPSGSVVRNERLFTATPGQIFAAFESPETLARWWGPKDFTNTFERFEFKPDGRWTFVMHGPSGANYANESVFREIVRDSRIVLEHIVKPWYRLTITLTQRGAETHLLWEQEFESPAIADNMRPLCRTANEQNLDRLEAVLSRAHR
jgi:uncharacterized protein YndB with AHSA1/START domain